MEVVQEPAVAAPSSESEPVEDLSSPADLHRTEDLITKNVDGSHSCTVCGYSTKYFSSVQVHARTHTNEKPFACSFCPYASAQLSNLKKHVAIHLKKEAVARADAARVASKLRNPSEIDVNGNGLSEPGDESAENAVEAKPGVLTRRAVALSVQAMDDAKTESEGAERPQKRQHVVDVSAAVGVSSRTLPPHMSGVGFQPVVIPHRYVTTDTLAGAPGRLPPAPLPSMVYYPSHAPYYPPVMAQAEVPTTLTHATLNVAAIQQYAPHVRRVSMHTSYGTVDTHVERKATGPLVPQSFVTSTSLQSSLQSFPWSGSIAPPSSGRYRLSSAIGQQLLQTLGSHVRAPNDFSTRCGTCGELACVPGLDHTFA